MDDNVIFSQRNDPDGDRISRRKDEHIAICLHKDVTFCKTNGFERFELRHKALPELNLADIDISTTFLGNSFSYPFFIEGMTGGSLKSGVLNRNLARAAAELNIGMGVGSQRAMLTAPDLSHTYQIRSVAPDILLLGNIGASQLKNLSTGEIANMVNSIGANGLAIHLNAAQEMCQPEGDTNWRNVLLNIERICSQARFPVIVKETGCGIDGESAYRLASAGVAGIDVAGAGGTSFTKVELCRRSCQGHTMLQGLGDWGIPTAESLQQCRGVTRIPLIASGGLRTGLECAKAIAMGASLVGFALPLLQAASRSHHHVVAYLSAVAEELRKVMLLVGVQDLAALKKIVLLRKKG